jgi:hypothetical protein
MSDSTLERWRGDRIGPVFLKIRGRVLYRHVDIEAFEVASQKHGGTAPSGSIDFGSTASKSPRFRHFSPRFRHFSPRLYPQLTLAVNSCHWSPVLSKPLIYKGKSR